jgi:hypothetical protein
VSAVARMWTAARMSAASALLPGTIMVTARWEDVRWSNKDKVKPSSVGSTRATDTSIVTRSNCFRSFSRYSCRCLLYPSPYPCFPLCSPPITPPIDMSTAWDNARRHARALETALEAKLSSYSKLAATISRGPAGAGSSSRDVPSHEDEGVGGYKLVEEEVEELLGKVSLSTWTGMVLLLKNQLEQAIDDLMALINSPSQPPSTSMQHAAQRHRDNLDDYRRDFVRTRVGPQCHPLAHNRTMSNRPWRGRISWVRSARISGGSSSLAKLTG